MISVIEKEYMETVIRMGKRLLRNEPDWEQRRYEIAKDIMGTLSHRWELETKYGTCGDMSIEAIVNKSVEAADVLIAKLKQNK